MQEKDKEWLQEVWDSSLQDEQSTDDELDFSPLQKMFEKKANDNLVVSKSENKGIYSSFKEDYLEGKKQYNSKMYKQEREKILAIKKIVTKRLDEMENCFNIANKDIVINDITGKILNLYNKHNIVLINEDGFYVKKKFKNPYFVKFSSFLFGKLTSYMGEGDSIKYKESYIGIYRIIRSRILSCYKADRECYYELLGSEEYINALTNDYVSMCMNGSLQLDQINAKNIKQRLEKERLEVLKMQSKKIDYRSLLELSLLCSTIASYLYPPFVIAYITCNLLNTEARNKKIENERMMLLNIDPPYYGSNVPTRK